MFIYIYVYAYVYESVGIIWGKKILFWIRLHLWVWEEKSGLK